MAYTVFDQEFDRYMKENNLNYQDPSHLAAARDSAWGVWDKADQSTRSNHLGDTNYYLQWRAGLGARNDGQKSNYNEYSPYGYGSQTDASTMASYIDKYEKDMKELHDKQKEEEEQKKKDASKAYDKSIGEDGYEDINQSTEKYGSAEGSNEAYWTVANRLKREKAKQNGEFNGDDGKYSADKEKAWWAAHANDGIQGYKDYGVSFDDVLGKLTLGQQNYILNHNALANQDVAKGKTAQWFTRMSEDGSNPYTQEDNKVLNAVIKNNIDTADDSIKSKLEASRREGTNMLHGSDYLQMMYGVDNTGQNMEDSNGNAITVDAWTADQVANPDNINELVKTNPGKVLNNISNDVLSMNAINDQLARNNIMLNVNGETSEQATKSLGELSDLIKSQHDTAIKSAKETLNNKDASDEDKKKAQKIVDASESGGQNDYQNVIDYNRSNLNTAMLADALGSGTATNLMPVYEEGDMQYLNNIANKTKQDFINDYINGNNLMTHSNEGDKLGEPANYTFGEFEFNNQPDSSIPYSSFDVANLASEPFSAKGNPASDGKSYNEKQPYTVSLNKSDSGHFNKESILNALKRAGITQRSK